MRSLLRCHPGGSRGLVQWLWIPAFAGMTLVLLSLPLRAETLDVKIAGLLASIERSSEKGDYADVQVQRKTLADYAVTVRHYEIAARQYELLLAARPRRKERVRLFTQLGNVRMILQDYSRAISAFDDALHDSPKDWDANLLRARAFTAIDLNQRAIESYQRCIKLKPTDATAYEELAQVYEKQGFLGKALTHYRQALSLEPRPTIYLHMADCYVHQKNMAQAIEVLSQAKARLPSAEYDVRLGDIYQSLGDLAHAGAAWEEAIKADPKRDDVRLKLSLIYDRLHRPSDADRMSRDLIATYPDSPLVHFVRAMVLLGRGDKDGARLESQRVEALSPTELVAHYNSLLMSKLRNSL